MEKEEGRPVSEMRVMRVDLEKMRVTALAEVSEEVLRVVHNVETFVEKTILGNLVVRLQAEVYGKQESVEIEWPDGWVQAFKDRWFPKWAKKRWPVRMESRLIYARTIFEGIPDMPDKVQHFSISVLQRPKTFRDGEAVRF